MKKQIQSAVEMERITRKYFCDNMDEVLETVDKENKGFVLTEEGKNDLVLCPAKWLMPFDNRYSLMLISAIRYALPRKTYLPNEIINYAKENIDLLSLGNLKNILRDVEEAIENDEVDSMYENSWLDFTDTIRKRISTLKE